VETVTGDRPEFRAVMYVTGSPQIVSNGHVDGPPAPAVWKFRFAFELAVPLRSGWSGYCLQIVERVLMTLRLGNTQDKCQSLRDRGALGWALSHLVP
jgi:hypothetical protein